MMIKITSKKDRPNTAKGLTRPRVLVVGPHPSQIGGVATFLGILLSSTTLQEKYELIHLDTSRGKHGSGVAGRFVPINIIYFVRQYVQFLKISLRDKPQIAHVPINMSWAFWKEAAFVLLARILGMKVVAHLHEGVFDQYFHKSPSMIRWLIGWVMSHADIIIALSNRSRNFLLREVRSDLHVEVIPNTVDPMFASAMNAIKRENEDKVILFVGTMSDKKGVFDILKAIPIVVSYFKDTRFLFAGSPENAHVEKEITRLCVEGNLIESVQFLGVITGQEKLTLFQTATVFVLPSYVDNFPYALLEAMSTGLPVITTPVGAIPELVENNKNGFLIAPGDYMALADRIIELLQNPVLRHDMALTNTSLIQRDYLPEIASCRFNQIYSNLVFA